MWDGDCLLMVTSVGRRKRLFRLLFFGLGICVVMLFLMI